LYVRSNAFKKFHLICTFLKIGLPSITDIIATFQGLRFDAFSVIQDRPDMIIEADQAIATDMPIETLMLTPIDRTKERPVFTATNLRIEISMLTDRSAPKQGVHATNQNNHR
jgi:hypothetical protein